MEECIFCSIAAKKTPSFFIYEDNYVFACLDIQPANIGHVIVFPKRHISSILEAKNEETSSIIGTVRKVCLAMNACGITDFSIINQIGKSAGQRSPHTIIHIIPRHENDNIQISWTGKQFDKETFQKIQSMLTNAINKKEEKSEEKEKRIEKVISEKIPDYWT
ncbi:MAG: HIT family protein [Candidatus Parvarchaeota archaeon]|nr:HIT family protein [Candidatus Jingweiarchaeum tengchongense]MCW1298356.1 HIT family protein [Candidatus Jingweiarchaeum tengchongense]MCW1300342.1 HIT family protein [Candidatus Jingweiarchaeum tengchongense]MCW1304861.1 HIT family protein [Candidatus Jingweiarchaeum tengchongense]MCW1305838.1 HIT family protein [Candidatus Jingweiarchaeum tengchongense]